MLTAANDTVRLTDAALKHAGHLQALIRASGAALTGVPIAAGALFRFFCIQPRPMFAACAIDVPRRV